MQIKDDSEVEQEAEQTNEIDKKLKTNDFVNVDDTENIRTVIVNKETDKESYERF